jgi:hypothetical protein
MSRFAFAFDPRARRALALIGVREASAYVDVGGGAVEVRYGPWHLRTSVTNVREMHETGPYQWFKAVGPHLSLKDRGVTFGTTDRAGLCLLFNKPVPALAPFGLLRHPGATVTVAAPAELAAAVRGQQSTEAS